jgi:hypothetical protein
MNLATKFRDTVAPKDRALWERAMVDTKTYEKELGHHDEVPIFDPRIIEHGSVGDVQMLHSKKLNSYGTCENFETLTSFGIDYTSRLYIPAGGSRYPFYVDIDTPLSTGVNGLNADVAERIMHEVGVPVLLKGPEFSASHGKGPLRLAKTALDATNISQSFSAETSMAISERIISDADIDPVALVYGKSRGAMLGSKKYTYAKERGIEIPHYRLIDPCIGDRALDSPIDALRYATWIPRELIGSVPSFAKFALEGNLRSRAKTVETNMHYITGMIAGTVPSLLSGEPMAARIPKRKGVSLVHMDSNPIADTEQHLEEFVGHDNFDHQSYRNTHIGGIILARNIGHTVHHMQRFGESYQAAGHDEAKVNYDYVHRKAGPPSKGLTAVA